MSTTLTLRTDPDLRRSLEERARAEGKTLSEVTREILRAAVEARPLGARTGHLRGSLRLGSKRAEPWREVLRRQNWRP